MALIIHYSLCTIHYLQFTIHYLHCRSFWEVELKPSFHLQNQLSICWFSVLKFLAPKRNYWCYSRLHALIHDQNVLYIQRGVYASSPRPAERERNMGLTRGDGKHGTCGPPERRPVERKRSRPGGSGNTTEHKSPRIDFARLWDLLIHHYDILRCIDAISSLKIFNVSVCFTYFFWLLYHLVLSWFRSFGILWPFPLFLFILFLRVEMHVWFRYRLRMTMQPEL